jgi:hypothetical protein
MGTATVAKMRYARVHDRAGSNERRDLSFNKHCYGFRLDRA